MYVRLQGGGEDSSRGEGPRRPEVPPHSQWDQIPVYLVRDTKTLPLNWVSGVRIR